MSEEIGTMAGAIWQTLEANGEMTLAKLKKELKAKSPLFDWAIGWLAREDKIMLTMEKRSFASVSRDGIRKACTPLAISPVEVSKRRSRRPIQKPLKPAPARLTSKIAAILP